MYRVCEAGVYLAVRVDVLAVDVDQRLLVNNLTVIVSADETDPGSFIRNEARSVCGILARLFLE